MSSNTIVSKIEKKRWSSEKIDLLSWFCQKKESYRKAVGEKDLGLGHAVHNKIYIS